MAMITTTEAAAAIPTMIAQKAQGYLAANILLSNIVNQDYKSAVAEHGDTVKVPRRGILAANSLTDGASVTVQNPTTTQISVVLDNHWETTFAVSSPARIESEIDLLNGYAEDAAIVLGEKVESVLLTLAQGCTYSIGTPATPMTTDMVLQADKQLNATKAPVNDRFLIVSNKDRYALLGSADVKNAYAYGRAIQPKGELTDLWNFSLGMSQLTTTTGSAPISTWNLAMQKNGITLVTREMSPADGAVYNIYQDTIVQNGIALRVTYSFNNSTLSWQITFDVLFGAKRIREEFLCAVIS